MAGVVYRPSLLLLPLLLILGRVHDGMETRRQARDNSKGGGWWRDWLVGWLVVSVGDLYEVGPSRDCRIRWVHDAQEERVTRVWRRSRLRVLCCAKKETAISTGSLVGGAFGASDASSSWSAAQHPPVARTRAPARLRLGDDLDVFFRLLTRVARRNRRATGCAARPLVPRVPTPFSGKLCGWAGLTNSPYSIAAMGSVN